MRQHGSHGGGGGRRLRRRRRRARARTRHRGRWSSRAQTRHHPTHQQQTRQRRACASQYHTGARRRRRHSPPPLGGRNPPRRAGVGRGARAPGGARPRRLSGGRATREDQRAPRVRGECVCACASVARWRPGARALRRDAHTQTKPHGRGREQFVCRASSCSRGLGLALLWYRSLCRRVWRARGLRLFAVCVGENVSRAC
jgi:hypothetical protein